MLNHNNFPMIYALVHARVVTPESQRILSCLTSEVMENIATYRKFSSHLILESGKIYCNNQAKMLENKLEESLK